MHSYEGISLIEVLISLLILSFCLLGLDAIEVSALRKAKAAYYFSVATQQLQNMMAMLDASTGHDEALFSEWNAENHEVLPEGHGTITRHGKRVDLAIFWGHFPRQECNTNQIGQAGCISVSVNH